MPDVSWDELLEKAEKAVKHGGSVYQKWTCLACGERCCSDEANVFHESMIHTDCAVEPGYETDCKVNGGGLLFISGKTKDD